jgi:hypothetical protein
MLPDKRVWTISGFVRRIRGEVCGVVS